MIPGQVLTRPLLQPLEHSRGRLLTCSGIFKIFESNKKIAQKNKQTKKKGPLEYSCHNKNKKRNNNRDKPSCLICVSRKGKNHLFYRIKKASWEDWRKKQSVSSKTVKLFPVTTSCVGPAMYSRE